MYNEMEMPCPCSCGEWFDLNNGYPSTKNNRELVCQECHALEENIEEIKDQIEDLELQGNKKREIAKLKKKLVALGYEEDDKY